MRRAVERLRGVPAPLAALLVAVTFVGVSWALINPAWQAPDEDVHFSYVQTLAELHRLPGTGGNSLSSAQVNSMQATNTDPVVFFSYARPEWSETAWDRYRFRSPIITTKDGGGQNTASGYPPAFYLAGLIGYKLAGSDDVLSRLYATRFVSIFWLLVTTIGAWLFAGELFGRRRELQLVTAACVGLWPMLDFISSSVNPDALMYATWSLALWLGVRILRRGLTFGQGLAFGAVVGVALVTKAPSLALLPAAAFVGLWSLGTLIRAGRYRAALILTGAAVLAFAIPVEAWRLTVAAQDRPAYGQAVGVTGRLDVAGFLSYLWQFYLPRLPSQTRFTLDSQYVSTYPAFNAWVATGWAAFGWVTVYFPLGVYKLFFTITSVIAAAATGKGAVLLWRNRRSRPALAAALPVAIFLAMAAGALVLGLHIAEYNVRGPTNQGRYLFPLASLGGAAVAAAVTLVPGRARAAAIGLVLGGLVVYQLACLGLMASHYYA